jgi:Ras-related GTP-binding protein A/B
MGKGSAGKTSMRSIIFANYTAKDTRRLGATLEVELSNFRFFGNMMLNLWDCGGQDHFMENYFASQRDNIFRNVAVLIYVFDISSTEPDKDMNYYTSSIEALFEHSKDAKVFCLVHKMDLVHTDTLARFRARESELVEKSEPFRVVVYPTSIFDESLFKAWSDIMHSMVPNIKKLERHLVHFREVCEADEIVLFERATFLVIATAQKKDGRDVTKYEKISTMVKQFKHSCSKMRTEFKSMEIRRPHFSAFVETLTNNTFVLVITSDASVQSTVTQMNINQARKHFEKLEAMQQRT